MIIDYHRLFLHRRLFLLSHEGEAIRIGRRGSNMFLFRGSPTFTVDGQPLSKRKWSQIPLGFGDSVVIRHNATGVLRFEHRGHHNPSAPPTVRFEAASSGWSLEHALEARGNRHSTGKEGAANHNLDLNPGAAS